MDGYYICMNDRMYTLATQSVAHGAAASVLPGSMLEMQNLRPHPRSLESESAF